MPLHKTLETVDTKINGTQSKNTLMEHLVSE